MSIGRFFSKLDDWVNPIVVKELRQAVRSRLVVAALMLFLTLQVGLLGITMLNAEASGRRDTDVFRAGRDLFQKIQVILLGTCLLVPVYAGIRLGAERSDTNVDLLFISTLRPWAIVSGKLFSAVVLVLLIFSACTPFMTFTYLLRGLDMPTILLILAIDFLAALWAIQASLFLAVVPAPPAVRGLFLLAGLGCLIGLFASILTETRSLLRYGLGPSLDTGEFWAIVLAVVVVVLGLIGTTFVWSVAVLKPPSANRSLPVRLYLVFFWLATWAAMAFFSRRIAEFGPLMIWVGLQGGLFALMLLVATNERETWGPRITRTIPRRAWLRLPAFLLYSGSAGGVAFATLMLGLTVGIALLALENAGLGNGLTLVAVCKFVVLLGLYTYCYGLSAIAIRRALFARHLKPSNTWVVVLLLLGLGSVLPHMVAYFLFPETLHYPRHEGPWQMTNPFVSIEEALSHRNSNVYLGEISAADAFDAPCLPFLAVWAVVVSALALPWFLQQLLTFRPLARSQDRREGGSPAPAEAAEVVPVTESSATS